MAFSKRQRRGSMSMSVQVISRAIRTGKVDINTEETNDMRNEYLSIVDDKSIAFTKKKQNMYDQIVEPIYKSLKLKAKTYSSTILVINKKENKFTKLNLNNRIICFGRLYKNDVFLSADKAISRIQGYMFVAGEKIIFLDVWSISGTKTLQRSNILKLPLSTLPQRRNVLMFDKAEIIHLNVAKVIDILIIPHTADNKLLKKFQIYQSCKQIKRSVVDDKIHNSNHSKKERKIDLHNGHKRQSRHSVAHKQKHTHSKSKNVDIDHRQKTKKKSKQIIDNDKKIHKKNQNRKSNVDYGLIYGSKHKKKWHHSSINNIPNKKINKIVHTHNRVNRDKQVGGENRIIHMHKKIKHKKLSQKKQEFKDWICDELELQEYYELFLNNGFDDIDVVKLLNDDDLKKLGVDKKGSRMKIMLYSKKMDEQNDTFDFLNIDNGTLNEGNVTNVYDENDQYMISNDSGTKELCNDDILEWMNNIGLSDQWKRIAVNAIKECQCNGKDFMELNSGKDVAKLLNIQNPMLCSRLWKEIKKMK